MIQIYLNSFRNTAWCFPGVFLAELRIIYSDTVRDITSGLSSIAFGYTNVEDTE